MVATSKKLVNVTNEMMDCLAKMTSFDSFKRMSEEEIKLVKLSLQMVDLVNEYTVKNAVMLDQINSKLDKLNEKRES